MLVIYALCEELRKRNHWALASQLSRASLSVPTNIVEGSARHTENDYLRFLYIALGSASEVSYLLSVTRRVAKLDVGALEDQYSVLTKGLQRLIDATLCNGRLRLRTEGRGLKAEG